MSLTTAFWICLTGLGFLRLIVIPSVRSQLKRSPSQPGGGWLALWSFLQTYLLLATATLGVILAGVSWIESQGGTTLEELREAKAWVEQAQGFSAKVGGTWAIMSLLGIVVALGGLAYRRGRLKIQAALEAARSSELERIRRQAEAGTLAELPPTAEMQRVVSAMIDLDQELSSLPSNSELPFNARRQEVMGLLEQLQIYLVHLDVQRRMNIELRPEDVRLPKPQNWRERVGRFFMSEGLLWCLGKGGRFLYATAFVLLIASLIGFSVPRADAQLVQEHNRLDNLISSLEFLSNDFEPWLDKTEAFDEDEDGSVAQQIAQVQEELTDIQAELDNDEEDDDDEPDSHKLYRTRLTTLSKVVTQVETQLDSNRNTFQQLHDRIPDPRGPPTPEQRTTVRTAAAELKKTRVADAPDAAQKTELKQIQAKLDASSQPETLVEARRQVEVLERRLDDIADRQTEQTRRQRALAKRQLDSLEIQRERIDRAFSRLDAVEQTQLAPVDRVRPEVTQSRNRVESLIADREATYHDLKRTSQDLDHRLARIDEQRAELKRTREQLVAEYHHAEARADWTTTREGAGSARDLTEADRQVLRQFAQDYERAVTESDYLRDFRGQTGQADFEVRSTTARDTILSRAAARAPTQREHISVFENSALDPPVREVLDAYRQDGNAERGLRLESSRTFYRELETAARNNPKLVGELKAKLAAAQESGHFQRAAIRGNLRTALIEHFTGVSQGRETSSVLQSATPELRNAMQRGTETRMYRVLHTLTGDGSLQDAMELAKSDPAGRSGFTPTELEQTRIWVKDGSAKLQNIELNRPLTDHPPSLVAKSEPHVKIAKARELINQYSHSDHLNQALGERPPSVEQRLNTLNQITEPLAQYEDYFPNQLRGDLETERGRFVDEAFRRQNSALPDIPDIPTSFNPSNSATSQTKAARLASLQSSRARASFQRGRSFSRLRGFRRIGGVLIGRDPTGTNINVEVVDLEWTVDDSQVVLTLIDQQGQRWTSRPYHRPLVEMALAYAADGRPTTVTMVKNSTLQDWRIMLHPSLVDTPLGFEAIELDRFVDRFTGSTPWRSESETRVRKMFQLYAFARLNRLLVLKELGVYEGEEMAHIVMQFETELKAFKTDELETLIQDPDALKDGKEYPLTVKSEFFDPRLAEAIIQASRPGQTWEGFQGELTKAAKKEFGRVWSRHSWTTPSIEFPLRRESVTLEAAPKTSLPDSKFDEAIAWQAQHKSKAIALNARVEAYNRQGRLRLGSSSEKIQLERELAELKADEQKYSTVIREVLNRWISEVPEFEVWSGVRERNFHITAEQLLAQDVGESPDVLQFMLQIAFTSPPGFRNGVPVGYNSNEDDKTWAENYDDQNPWEFPVIADKIESEVRTQVAKATADDQRILAHMQEFTLLQRLFRAALDGQLGMAFPVGKLAELHEAAGGNSSPRHYRTLRWHSRPGTLEQQAYFALTLLTEQFKSTQEANPSEETANALAASKKFRDLLKGSLDIQDRYQSSRSDLIAAREEPEFDPTEWAEKWDADWKQYEMDRLAWEKNWQEAAQTFEEQSASTPPDAAILEQFIARVSHQISLRRSLGISRDDRQSVEENVGLRPLPESWLSMKSTPVPMSDN